MLGRTISHYRIISQLGAGGMGVVYRAEDVRLGRAVALKFISEELASDEQAIQRLRSEARAASALNHGNICTIYDVGDDAGRPFIVMELMKGENLRDRLARGPLEIHQLVDIGLEIADALHATHSDGIIHRDIKPGNIFLTENGHVKLLDFGLAKLTPRFPGLNSTGANTLEATVAGVTLGTVSYMSPEQATGETLDGRSDLFSLGVVLYESATGQHPFPGKTSAVTLAAILHKEPAQPLSLNRAVPLRLQEVIHNCLEKDRELRYQSAADLRADLKRVRRDIESGNTAAIPWSGRGSSRQDAVRLSDGTVPLASSRHTAMADASVAPRRSRMWLIGGSVFVALLVVGGYFLSQTNNESVPAAVPAAVTDQPASLADTAVENRLSLATASLQARNYRAAAAYAAEVLAVSPGHAEATKIRDESQGMLTRFDTAVADARQRITAGDVAGAARALGTARDIDPTAPSLVEISARLNELLRQSPAPRQAREVDRPEPKRETSIPVSPQAPPPAAPVPPPPVRPAPEPQPAPVTPVVPAPQAEPVAPPPKPAPPPPAPSVERKEPDPAAAAAAQAEQDEASIRRLVASYARAIETKDLALFRSIKPNLSREEERRLQDGFRAVTSQRVSATVVSIDRRGDEATVAVRRRDTIDAGGRQQTSESQQTIVAARSGAGWVIVAIR